MKTYETVADCPGYDAWRTDPGYGDADEEEETYSDDEHDEMVLDCDTEGCCMPGYHFRSECHTAEMMDAMEHEVLKSKLFEFLCSKYVQRADERQKAMQLQYIEAETHDLASELAAFILSNP